MPGFAEQLSEWRDFYIVAATAAATFVGLLFVSLSLHPSAARSGLATIARSAFVAFISILVVAFLFLVPAIDPFSFGAALLVVAAINARATVVAIRALRRDRRPLPTTITVYRMALGVASVALLAAAGVLALAGRANLYLVAVALALLGVEAARSSWDLLVASRRDA